MSDAAENFVSSAFHARSAMRRNEAGDLKDAARTLAIGLAVIIPLGVMLRRWAQPSTPAPTQDPLNPRQWRRY